MKFVRIFAFCRKKYLFESFNGFKIIIQHFMKLRIDFFANLRVNGLAVASKSVFMVIQK